MIRARLPLVVAAVVAAGLSQARAQEQPITSPQDAQCREEARNRVFSAPNPKGLSLYNLGSEIYFACMRRLGADTRRPSRRQ
ncbi:hypothetical protein [Methylobacterium aerolatum]|uniref:Uncharacterized protein n=1 Tax=Methylobacterium aerolatum TaxID=418708 RepID=A0ABU0I3U7_9HYPH|nr:hypothetical protein [Methylobacterium aerolatum]MDQ0449282.1 hypothetical protein [Methylobacterium aerolatum]GJD35466.1 hypothetical protein FMGBMHLM_2376 [Methylobacterium aerolatum]